MADARPFHWEYQPEAPPPEAFRIEGGRPLRGTVHVCGAKNAALKLLAAAVLTGERCRFENVPEIEDVRVMTEVLRDLGVVVDHPAHGVYEIAAGDVDWLFVPLEAAAKMRASFILLGPLLARFGRVIISNPGGDRIGRRPVNLHVDAMRALGAEIDYRNGYYYAQAPGRLRGGEVIFPQVTVMGTENAMLAATLADGHTIDPARGPGARGRRPHRLPAQDGRGRQAHDPGHDRGPRQATPARREPHRGARPDRDRHVPRRRGGHRRQADPRERAPATHVGALRRAARAGGRARVAAARPRSRSTRPASGPGDLRACDIETSPYPGLATDLQPPTCVLLTQARGTSRVHEAIFEDRIEWLAELRKLGADGSTSRTRTTRRSTGPSRLHGAEASISDLRAGASLILAALAADGDVAHPRRAPRSPGV